jgi:hypothetical protein
MKRSHILSDKKFDGKKYSPAFVTHTKQDAEERANEIRGSGDLARIVPFPKNISAEEYGEGPGMYIPIRYIVYRRKR